MSIGEVLYLRHTLRLLTYRAVEFSSGRHFEGFWCRQAGELAIMGYGASQSG